MHHHSNLWIGTVIDRAELERVGVRSGDGDVTPREQHQRYNDQCQLEREPQDQCVRALPDEGYRPALLREALGQDQGLHG